MHSATCPDYTQGSTPQDAYNQWKSNWTPPEPPIRCLNGKILVEFSPYATETKLWTPEQASFQAMVVNDSFGELKPGTEVALEAIEGQNFQYDGRTLCSVNYSAILGVLP